MDELSLSHVTKQDPTLTHQVQLHLNNHVVYVSCNCRKTVGEHAKAGKLYYDPIGPSKNIEESRRLYNDPINHWAPFSDDDKARW